jgi:predicted GH43/DUF377 family glycosyl hydrolase
VETVEFFGFKAENIKTVEIKELSNNLTLLDPIKSANPNPPNPDTMIKNMLLKVNTLSPQVFWREMSLLSMMNPSITKWKDRYLVAYRNGTSISMCWFKIGKFSHHLSPNYYDNFLNIRNFQWNTTLSSSMFQEDPRLFVQTQRENQLTMTFVRLHFPLDTAQLSYVNLTVNEQTNQLELSGEVALVAGGKQKNWVPMEYQGDLYWITSINPMHIVKHSNTIHVDSSRDHWQGQLETIVHSDEELPLPWAAEFGLPIRGGTQAIKVRGVYFAFFHTLSNFQTAFGLQTYFMGAISFCPEPPFRIHAISPFPILRDLLYQGGWHNAHRDFVVFPAGIAVDEREEFVFVSFGHQDAHGYLAKFDVTELFQSMEIVSECPSSGNGSGNSDEK